VRDSTPDKLILGELIADRMLPHDHDRPPTLGKDLVRIVGKASGSVRHGTQSRREKIENNISEGRVNEETNVPHFSVLWAAEHLASMAKPGLLPRRLEVGRAEPPLDCRRALRLIGFLQKLKPLRTFRQFFGFASSDTCHCKQPCLQRPGWTYPVTNVTHENLRNVTCLKKD
jgi:hypothetical protein